MVSSRSLLALAATSLLPFAAHAFNFTTPLAQCANITMSWRGGQAPYEILLVPVGHLVPEVRTIINYQNIASNATEDGVHEFSFPLTFPAGSQFVAVLSDAQYGPGSGGTSEVLTVEEGEGAGSECLGTKQVKPEFYFYLDPPTPTQCNPWEISWPQSAISSLSSSTNSSSNDDAISIWAVTPGGPSFSVPLPSQVDPDISSRECSAWTVDVQAGTQVMLVAGYTPSEQANGRGKGGSTDLFKVAYSSEKSCLVDDPPATSAFPSTTAPSSTSSLASGTGVAPGPGPTSSVSGSPQGAVGSSGGAGQLVPGSIPLALAVLVGSVIMGAL